MMKLLVTDHFKRSTKKNNLFHVHVAAAAAMKDRIVP